MHIHLDLLGGIAGDMFIAAMTDAFPKIKPYLEQTLSEAGFPELAIEYSSKNDGVLVGLGFKVQRLQNSSRLELSEIGENKPEDFNESVIQREHQPKNNFHPHKHRHRSYAEIRRILEKAKLPESVRDHSLKIFQLIGEAESKVHGVDIGKIEFHEVGGWDSVVDVVGAACITDYLRGATWSCKSVPMGGGFIETAHGKLPVPPPAVALLLSGFVFHDDGVMGERVTPTGAAILKYLRPQRNLPAMPLELKEIGHGFGTKKLAGLSNVLRVLSFDQVSKTLGESITILNFEIDDMTGEELSVSLEKLRTADGVIDVLQMPVYGKKNRIAISVQVLAHPASVAEITEEILSNTTTLGVRHQNVSRTILSREIIGVQVGQDNVRVKVADRPGGIKTAKVEIDDVTSAGDCYKIRKLASAAENSILKDINE